MKQGWSPLPGSAPATSEGGALTGSLGLVEYPAAADVLVVAAQDGLYLVDPRGAGVTVTDQVALDRTTRLGLVELSGAPGEKLEGSTPELVQRLLDTAAVLAANDLVGIARRALTDTVEYDKTRVQFGKPVGSFQAIKHDLADLHIAITFAEHAATYAAYALDDARPDAQLAASIAKAKASDAADTATAAMIQYHGGIGYTWEHHAHFYFKRCKRLQAAYGDAAQHRERIATLVIDAPGSSDEVTGVTPGGSSGVQGSGVAAGAVSS